MNTIDGSFTLTCITVLWLGAIINIPFTQMTTTFSKRTKTGSAFL